MNRGHNIAVVDRRSLILECVTRILADRVCIDPHGDTTFNILPFSSMDALCEALSIPAETKVPIDLVIFSIGSSPSVMCDVQAMMDQFIEYRSDIPVVVLSESDNRRDIFEAFRRGVRGYLIASMNAEQVIDALRLVLEGGSYIPECMLGETAVGAVPVLTGGLSQAATSVLDLTPVTRLTPRQRAVLDLLRKGFSNRVIAKELSMREGTVKVHVAHIMRKLHARNRTHAAFLADQSALLECSSPGSS